MHVNGCGEASADFIACCIALSMSSCSYSGLAIQCPLQLTEKESYLAPNTASS